MRDRGVPLDTWSRNIAKTLGAPLRPRALYALMDALTAGIERKNSQLLCSVRATARRGFYPTEAQLKAVNDQLEKRGMQRVSCPVRVLGKDNPLVRMAHTEKASAVAAIDSILAAPIPKPPRRFEWDAVNERATE